MAGVGGGGEASPWEALRAATPPAATLPVRLAWPCSAPATLIHQDGGHVGWLLAGKISG